MVRSVSALILVVLFCCPQLAPAQGPGAVLHEIIIEGNTRTQQSVVERIIALEPGAPFDLRAFDAVWDRLEDCGYFAFVDLATETDDEGRVTLWVTLEEEQTAHYAPSVRYSLRHKYLLGGAVRDINLRGRGEVLEVQAIVYRIQRGRVAWTKPWLFAQDGLSLNLDTQWEQGPFVWRPFDYAQWHARLGLRQHLSSAFYVEGGGGFASFRQKDAYQWALPDRGQDTGEAIATFPGATRDLWSLRGLIGLDTRDNPFYPHRGQWHEIGLVWRTGPDDLSFTTYHADLRAYIGLPGPGILALRAGGRGVDGPVPVEHALFWGGAETVRGAPTARREGEHGYLLSAELRWPLFLLPVAVTGEVVGFGLHAFFDVGDAWWDGADPGRALQSVGLGAHLSLLSLQLRFEAAHERDHGWSFVFMDVFNF